MGNCARQEKVLQLINNIQSTLDRIFIQMDEDDESLTRVKTNPKLFNLMKESETNVNEFEKILTQVQ